MAIYHKNNNIQTNAIHFVRTGQGSFELNISGVTTDVFEFDKLPLPFYIGSIGSAPGTHEGPLGSSFVEASSYLVGAVDDAQPAAGNIIEGVNSFSSVYGSDSFVLWSGKGKISITGTGATGETKVVEKNIADLPLPLHLSASSVELLQGAVAFTTAAPTGTSTWNDGYPTISDDPVTVLTEGAETLTTGDIVYGGIGKAQLEDTASGNEFEVVVNLSEMNYPFNLSADEELTALGSAMIFVDNN